MSSFKDTQAFGWITEFTQDSWMRVITHIGAWTILVFCVRGIASRAL